MYSGSSCLFNVYLSWKKEKKRKSWAGIAQNDLLKIYLSVTSPDLVCKLQCMYMLKHKQNSVILHMYTVRIFLCSNFVI